MTAIRRELRFILNDEEIVLADVPATRTLLDYLRLDKRLRGSKEGCAEGDCGACTVLVGRRRFGTFTYEAVTACITFLGMLDGTHVVTVEHLSKPGEPLHPVQKAMVDHHGSQCGFCTPGIVMSLEGLWQNNAQPTAIDIERALQGNLCRCTGYAPIVRAGLAVAETATLDDDVVHRDQWVVAERLRVWIKGDDDEPIRERVEIGEGRNRIIIPADVDDLAEIYLGEPQATLVAGATDVGLWVTKFMRDIGPLIFVGGLDELRNFWSMGAGEWEIGAACTYRETMDSLAVAFPGIGDMLQRLGGHQVRVAGTIGGNVANGSPIGDMPPALIALGADVQLRRGSQRRRVRLEDYFIAYGKQDRQPGEFVERIYVPTFPEAEKFAVYKISKRRDEDISSVCGAFRVALGADNSVTSVCIAFGGMAATPKRAKAVEAALLGKRWTSDTIEAALPAFAADYQPITDMRASAEYRLLAAQNLLRRFFLETIGELARLVREVA